MVDLDDKMKQFDHWLCQLGNIRTLLHDTEEEKNFYFTEKKYIDFAVKKCYN